jgi:hypothetical protein
MEVLLKKQKTDLHRHNHKQITEMSFTQIGSSSHVVHTISSHHITQFISHLADMLSLG